MDIRLLGHLEVADAGGVLISVPGDRQKVLLARLAVSYPHQATTDALVDVLWPEPVEDPDAALQVAVSRLRKSVGAKAIQTVPGGYRLDVPAGSIDVERFRAHTQRGRQLATLGHPGQAAEAFRQALAHWRASPLSDLRDYEFAEEFARRMESDRIDVVEWLMDAVLQAGDHQLVVGELAGLVEAHPTRERLWYLLMLALYRCGRQAEALRAYTRLRTVLGEELGIEPSRELAELEERILLHDPLLDDAEPATGTASSDEEPHVLTFKPGDVIVEEGTPADAVYWIEEGLVEVTRRSEHGEHRLAELGRGRYFGELASLLGSPRTASVRALEPTTVSVYSVGGFRHRLGVERMRAVQVGSAESVDVLMRRGDYLRAYDTATALIEQGDADVETRYRAVLSLAKAGATLLARRRYSSLGLDSIDPGSTTPRLTEDIAALRPRLDKDMAMREDIADRQGWARRSAQGYESAYRHHLSPYLGTNAASMWLLAGEAARATALAMEVLPAIVPDESYWAAATEAECALLLGRVDQARDALHRAGAAMDSDPTARASTLRQLRMVCSLQGVDSDILAPIHNRRVIHFTGHRIAIGPNPGRFPAAEESRAAAELKRHFSDLQAGVGYGSLAAGTDILAAEALLDLDAELHVVLPFARDEFVRVSVAPAGPDWVRRFERCLAAASDVTIATTSEYLDDPVLFDFCGQIAMGDALVRAKTLQTEAVQVAVWDGANRGGHAGTEVDISRWRAIGKPTVVIDVNGAGHTVSGPTDPPRRNIRALVFADFAGFSTLSDAQVVAFQDIVMASLAKTVARFEDNLLSGRTWGDGLYLVFDDVCAAADCALALQATVRTIDLAQLDLGGLRGLRVAAHAAPVFDGWDPIAGTRLFYGAGVTHTARVEPRTPEGEVYVTHPFAALAILSNDRAFEANYVGTLQAAKGYGAVPLYSLRSRRTQSVGVL